MYKLDDKNNNHLQKMKLLIKKSNEYDFPLHLASVDFQKAFNTKETWPFVGALYDARIDSIYSNLIENLYKNISLQYVNWTKS